MSQRWYDKASVQAALVGGIFILLATIVAQIIPLLSTNNAKLEVVDMLVSHINDACFLDFRIINYAETVGHISRISLEVIDYDVSPITGKQETSLEPSAIYGIDISGLQTVGEKLEMHVSQSIESNSSDRFIVKLTANEPDLNPKNWGSQIITLSALRQWVLKPTLLTNSGTISLLPCRVQFPADKLLRRAVIKKNIFRILSR